MIVTIALLTYSYLLYGLLCGFHTGDLDKNGPTTIFVIALGTVLGPTAGVILIVLIIITWLPYFKCVEE